MSIVKNVYAVLYRAFASYPPFIGCIITVCSVCLVYMKLWADELELS